MEPQEFSYITNERQSTDIIRKLSLRRQAEHGEILRRLQARKLNNPKKTKYEETLGVYIEELELQVKDAILVFNEKGYLTSSSGFWGRHGEFQLIEGPFIIDSDTIATLESLGVIVNISVDWRACIDSEINNRPMPTINENPYTEIKFRPSTANMTAIKETWDDIARLLPDKNQTHLEKFV